MKKLPEVPVSVSDPIVIETGDRFVFSVRSRRHASNRYRVDITACDGASECACADWSTHVWPNIRDGAPTLVYKPEKGEKRTLCWHGWQAHLHFSRKLLKHLARSEDEPSTRMQRCA